MTSSGRGGSDFMGMHRHGFVRLATSTPSVRPADVDYNRDSILDEARRADAAKVDLAVFPELCVSSYAIDDLHLQTALLDAVEAAVGDDRRRKRRPDACPADRRAAAALRPSLQLRAGDRARQAARGRPEELSAQLPRILREALVRARPQHRGPDHPGRRRGCPVRDRSHIRGERPRRLRLPHGDLRGLLGGRPAVVGRGARRRHDPGQPFRIQHHHRQVRRSPHAVPVAIGPRRGRLCLLGRRSRREHHRSRLGRAGRDLRARRSPCGIRAFCAGARALHRRCRHRADPRRAHADADLQRHGRGGRRASRRSFAASASSTGPASRTSG